MVMHVNSWQRVQALRRLLLILVAVSLIGLTVVVLRSPETIDRISNAIMGQTGNQASAATPQLAEEPPEKPVKKNLKRVRNPLNPPELLLESSQPDTVQVLPSQEVRRIIQRGPVQANVKTDSAAVYSSNSSRSSIVHVLKKGDRVETNMEVIDSGGRWSLVRPADSSRSGFVRSENLDRSQSGPAESRVER